MPKIVQNVVSRRRLLQAAGAAPILAATPNFWDLRHANAADGKPLVVAIGTDIVSMDPDKYASWNDYWAYGNMFEGLLVPGDKGDLEPGLAEKIEPSADGLSYRFTLRAGVKFHNGDPVTTDDIVFSLKRTLDPATRAQRAMLLGENLDGIEPIDQRSFVVKLKRVDSQTLQKLGLYWHVKPKKYIESVGDEAFARNPVGTGPFQFVERKPGEFFRIRAFADYWGRKPKSQEIVVRVVPEEQGRLAQVMAGEADVATPVSPVIAARMGNGPINVARVPAFLNVVIKFNYNHPEASKRLVRQAISHAIDKEAMLKSIMMGYAGGQELWCTDAQPACSMAGVTSYKYDPARARKLLEEAKFDFSKPFRFVGQAPGRVAASKETCEAIAEYLKRIGVQVDLQILEFGAWNAILNARHPKDPNVGMIFATSPDPSRDVAYKLQVNTKGGAIPSWVKDDENDAMLAKIDGFTDMKARDDFMNSILRRQHDEAFVLPLWSNDTLYATKKSVRFSVPPYYPFTILRDIENG
ncbi:MAG: ABC transporter substrate-binding protein [Alphaproteobacteria bacterium]|nr:ABC transporter substrate-binding protein [Alphaproteobacteria bacterium]